MPDQRRSRYARQVRAALVRTTASESNPNAAHKRCTVFGCGKPTQAFAGDGLSQRFCGSHVRHLARHGSAFLKSYSAEELKPYLATAQRWIKLNQSDSLVKRVEAAMQGLLDGAGSPRIATRMIRTSAKQKATNAIARLRVRRVAPSKLIAIVLATNAIIEANAHRGKEWRYVQIARQANRKAARFTPLGMEGKKAPAGSKLKYGHETFSPSSGPLLRILGKELDEVAGSLCDRAIPQILDMVRKLQIKAAHSQVRP